jgi:hypothetical protein
MPIGVKCTDPTHERRERTRAVRATGETRVYSVCVTCQRARTSEWKTNNRAARLEASQRAAAAERARRWQAERRQFIADHRGQVCACCGTDVEKMIPTGHPVSIDGVDRVMCFICLMASTTSRGCQCGGPR